MGALGAGVTLGAAAPGNESVPSKLGIINDEISQDLEQALEFIASYSLSYVELRSIGGKNIMSLSPPELERAKQIIDKHHFHVSDIASPIYKWNLPEMPALPSEKRDTFRASFTEEDAEDLLNKSFQMARLFGAEKVRIFSYWRVEDPDKAYPHVVKRLKKAAALAEQNKILLVLENEPSCNVGTGKELGRMLRDINSPWLLGNWDAANGVELNEVPYPDGYNHVRGLFRHMHIKDVARDPQTGKTHWMPVGGGVVDFRGQFQALIKDGYHGTMSLETHYRRPDGNKVESTRESLEGLLQILKSLKG
jgi:sugar phosphate isomerase/epimerase